MIPVTMERLTTEADAYRAAVASMLELDLEQVPTFDGMSADLQFAAWLGKHLNMVRVPISDFLPPPMVYLARVASPYLGYDLHTLVMFERAVLFDPHPEAQPIEVTGVAWRGAELFVPMDPAQLSGRMALT